VLVHHVREADVDGPLVGVIVSKHVGGAVVRNRVRRRIMAALGEYLSSLENQDLIVIRALPGAHQVPWDTLRTEIGEGIRRAAVRL
jgi:ribonuclease P protein component